ncbi:MAG: ATP-binding cassette domain-containing protein [Candidatus Aminicenantes bacterium]|nr:ATP-binding cassette domain-containing protein [Candidatus Aminicenantes bacterium]
MDIITVSDLDVGYGNATILKKLNFSIPKGQVTVMLGKSGCGKSTLMKTLIGLIPPLKGDIFFSGEKIDFLSEESLHSLYKRIGVLYQNGALLNSLNVYENVALPIRMRQESLKREKEERAVYQRLSQVGLGESLEKYPSELSGGMRKRAALARAMILDPEILFCDEPSAGLDPITSSGLDELLLDLKQTLGMTVVVVTHELRSIEKIADKVMVLREGEMHFSGKYEDLFSMDDAFIETFFLKKGRNHD